MTAPEPPASEPPAPTAPEEPASSPDPPSVGAGQVTGEEMEARRARAMRAARGALAGGLVLEAVTVLFVPRAIAPLREDGLTGGTLAVLLALAGLLLVAAGLQRSRAGPALGSVLQLAVIATGVLLPAMYVLGLVFAAAWVYLLRVRRDLARATAARPDP